MFFHERENNLPKALQENLDIRISFGCLLGSTKGGFKSEDAGEFLCCQIKYYKSLSLAENLNKLFTVLGGKFKFSAQDSDL